MLLDKFRDTCASGAEKLALIDSAGAVSFGEFARRVDGLAAALHADGLRMGQAVAMSIPDERDHLMASFALLRLGCPQVTFAAPDTAEQRRALIAKCGVAAVLASSAEADLGVPVIMPDFEAAASARAPAYTGPVPGDDTIAALFTGSGTTGTFKVIPVSHAAVVRQGMTRHVATASGVEYVPAPVEFLYPKKHRLRGLLFGYTSLLVAAEHSAIPEICRAYGVDILRLSPSQAQSLADPETTSRIPASTAVYVGGSRISGSLRSAFLERQTATLHVEYGATETGNIAVATPEMHALYPDGVGKPLPGVDLEIVDEDDRPLPAGVEGLIRIRTPGMASGYLNDEELTAKVFRGGWFRGGDRGSLTPEGVLVFGGRADDMMILGSINIFPAEIEKVAEIYPGVLECAAFPMRSSVHGDIPMLAVVQGDGCDLGGLLSHCRQHLGIRAPRKVVGLAEIPRNAQGKVQRRDLSARAARGEFR